MSGARQLRMALRAPLTAFEQAALDAAVAVCRAQLGDAPFAEHWRRGETLTLDQMAGQGTGDRGQYQSSVSVRSSHVTRRKLTTGDW